jgi:hypothetical protein
MAVGEHVEVRVSDALAVNPPDLFGKPAITQATLIHQRA